MWNLQFRMKRLSIFAKQVIAQWLAFISLAEFFIFIFPQWQVFILLGIALVFFFRFMGVILSISSGRRDSLNVDLLSFCLSLSLTAVATGLKSTNALILVLTPLLILPHIIHIFERR